MATGSYLTPTYSRSQSEVQGDLHRYVAEKSDQWTGMQAKNQNKYYNKFGRSECKPVKLERDLSFGGIGEAAVSFWKHRFELVKFNDAIDTSSSDKEISAEKAADETPLETLNEGRNVGRFYRLTVFKDKKNHTTDSLKNCQVQESCNRNRWENASQVAETVDSVYGADTVTANYVQFWFRRFRSGIFEVKDAPTICRPVVENVFKITEIIEVDRHVSSLSITQEQKIDHKTVLNHLYKVALKKKLDRGEAAPTLAKPGLTARKVPLCIWWNRKGIVYYELLPYDQTLNSDLYCQQLDRLKLAIDQKWPESANRRGVVFLEDNARPHSSVVTR
ncbi:putative DD34D transposase [Trichonephila clavipes]|nr:putative DD34D transposase [Trichonephila clavipes]